MPARLAGLVAGAAIVAVGSFVLLARPGSAFHRLFFVLALMDGLSTALFQFAFMATEPTAQRLYYGLYWWAFIAFVGLLATFGMVFPAPVRGRRASRAALVLLGAATFAAFALYAARHDLFWERAPGAAARFIPGPVGNAVGIAFVATIGLLLLRLTRRIVQDSSASHREQAAFVLGGMVIAYAPQPAAIAMRALLTDPVGAYVTGRADVVAAHAVYALATIALVASAVRILRDAREETARERRIVLAALVAAGGLAGLAGLFPAAWWTRIPLAAGLLAYPLLLGYAIARYEVFDIDRRVRRAATVTLAAAGLAATFFAGEIVLEAILQERLAAGISSSWVAGASAALVTAVVSIPLLRLSRRLASRVLPELAEDELRTRKLDIYRHALVGVMADGLVAERESRTLAGLRESLDIRPEDHERLLREVVGATRVEVEGPSALPRKAI